MSAIYSSTTIFGISGRSISLSFRTDIDANKSFNALALSMSLKSKP
jgi:hypothetical protein